MVDVVTAINTWAFQVAEAIANPQLNFIMGLLASSLFVVIPLVAIWLYYRKDKNVFSFLVAFAGAFVLGEIIKIIVQEPRPCTLPQFSWINQVGCEPAGYSFPSNHAIALTGPALFLRGYKYLRVLYTFWLLLVLFGRVYLGYHYLTDVIAGVVLSLLFAYLVFRNEDKINNAFISLLRIRMR